MYFSQQGRIEVIAQGQDMRRDRFQRRQIAAGVAHQPAADTHPGPVAARGYRFCAGTGAAPVFITEGENVAGIPRGAEQRPASQVCQRQVRQHQPVQCVVHGSSLILPAISGRLTVSCYITRVASARGRRDQGSVTLSNTASGRSLFRTIP